MPLRPGEWVVLAGSGLIAAFAALVGMLIYLKPPPVEYRYVENAVTRDGEAIYRREGCNSCHSLFGNGASYGPSLDGVGSRRSAQWLRQYLQDPKPGVSDKPYRLKMPSYRSLKSVELDALVAYLQGQRALGQDGALISAPGGR
ncbi:MAG TPA: c-type cytochrome [Burkholderiales bacterium]|nr:c-type cytochrome [Burkholderiales bacterium]